MTFQSDIPFLLGNIQTVEVFAASSTQAQGNGTVRAGITRVNTVGTNDDALTLPTAVKDVDCILINADNVQNAQLWSGSGDRIDGGSIDGSVRLWAGQTRWLKAFDDTDWRTVFQTPGFQPTMTAFATGGQVSATDLEAEVTRVSVVGTAGDSIKLPAAFPGLQRWVYNDSSNACDLFPNTSDAINGLAADTQISLAPGASVTIKALTAVKWLTF